MLSKSFMTTQEIAEFFTVSKTVARSWIHWGMNCGQEGTSVENRSGNSEKCRRAIERDIDA